MGLVGKTKGYFRADGPEGTLEGETITCPHCNRIEFLDPKAAPPGVCEHCWAPVCSRPQCQVCTPFEKKLELYEKKMKEAAQRHSLFKAMGI